MVCGCVEEEAAAESVESYVVVGSLAEIAKRG